MKILVLAPYFAPYGGVGSARMNSLTEYLAERHQVTVLSFDTAYYDRTTCTANVPCGVIIERVKNISKKRLFSLKYRKKVLELLANQQFDVCICTVGPYDAMYYIKAIRKYHVKVIIDYRDNWVYNFFKLNFKRIIANRLYSCIETRAFKYADAIVCVSDGQRDLIRKYYRLPEEKVITVKNGFDEKLLNTLDKSNNIGSKKFVATISGKCAYYDETAAYELLLAAKHLNEEGFSIEINHLGPVEHQMLEYCKKLSISDNLYHATGHVSYVDNVKRMMESDMLILPYSSVVGLGTKVFDYIFADKPILVIQKGKSELKEFVNQFEAGYAVEPNHIDIERAFIYVKENKIKTLGAKNKMEYSRLNQNTQYDIFLSKLVRG